MLARILFLPFVLAMAGGLLAQENPRIRNLGASGVTVAENWLVYSVYETFPDEDLNGDGDRGDRVFHVHDLSTGGTTNLRLAGYYFRVSGDWLVFRVREDQQSEDLNGDGDREDEVVHVHNLSTRETTNLGASVASLVDNWLVYAVWETFANEDLNGDGDREDEVVHVHDLSTQETTNLRLAVNGYRAVVAGDWLVFSVPESQQGEDLNGDGDREDSILHVHALTTGETTNLKLARYWLTFSGDWLVFSVPESEQGEDLNGDGDIGEYERVVHVHDLSTGETTNLRLAAAFSGRVSGDWLVFSVSESEQGEDLNGDGDIGEYERFVHVHDLSTGETTNLRLAGGYSRVSGDRLVFSVLESWQGEDLNGDGDREDQVVHVHNLTTGATTNLRLAGEPDEVSGDWLVFSVSESKQGEDLNGDGDIGEYEPVVHVHDLSTGETTNLRLTGAVSRVSGDWLVFRVSESWQGEDLNGDGDIEDSIVHVHNLSTGQGTNLRLAADSVLVFGDWLVFTALEQAQDLNGDGDREDAVAHVHNLSTGETTNLRLAAIRPNGRIRFFPAVYGDWLVLPVLESGQGEDLNGDGDIGGTVDHLVALTLLDELDRAFVRGDCNDDGGVDLSDAVHTLNWLFLGGPAPGCIAVTNTNGDDRVDLSDPVYLLSHLFLGGPPPVAPFPECGVGTLPADAETCEDLPASCQP